MRTRVTALTLTWLGVVGVSAAGAQTPLLDAVKAHDPATGQFSLTVAGTTPARTVRQLADEADLVIFGTVTSARPELTYDRTAIVSAYTIAIARTIVAGDTVDHVASRDSIEVEHLGGTLNILGQDVAEVDAVVPPFAVGDELVLFLKRQAHSPRFEILYDQFGVFRVKESRLSPIHDDVGGVNDDLATVTVDDLAAALSASRAAAPRASGSTR